MRTLLTKLAVVFTLFLPVLAPAPFAMVAVAQGDPFAACDDPNLREKPAICGQRGNTENPVLHLIKVALNILSIFAGVAAVIIIMLAGFNFITSGGNSEKISKARAMIMYAVIGLIIIALSQAIVRLVLAESAK